MGPPAAHLESGVGRLGLPSGAAGILPGAGAEQVLWASGEGVRLLLDAGGGRGDTLLPRATCSLREDRTVLRNFLPSGKGCRGNVQGCTGHPEPLLLHSVPGG